MLAIEGNAQAVAVVDATASFGIAVILLFEAEIRSELRALVLAGSAASAASMVRLVAVLCLALAVQELMAELDDLVGLGKVKAQMRDLLATVEFNLARYRLNLPEITGQSLHMAFLGNPGTGKTVVARLVGQLLVAMGAISGDHDGPIVTEVSRADLVGQYKGATAQKVQDVFADAQGGVLFIDEAYALVQSPRDVFGKEAVDSIIKLMEDYRDSVVVILAGYSTEMASFMAANPGFKSRVAFQFSFQDYTCSELLQIGSLQLASKGLVTSFQGSCQEEPSASCTWLRRGIQLGTGCCERADCDKEENRANGNGRSVRNLLEASYREMSSRVLTQYPPLLLTLYDAMHHPNVSNDRPNPPLDCGTKYEAIRGTGTYLKLEDTGGADVRCAFKLLEAGDVRRSAVAMLTQLLRGSCEASKTPVTVNMTLLAEDDVLEKLDWERLHDLLLQEKDCAGAQALLNYHTSHSLMQRWSEEDREDHEPEWGWGFVPESAMKCDVKSSCKVCSYVAEKFENVEPGEFPGWKTYDDLCGVFLIGNLSDQFDKSCADACWGYSDHIFALLQKGAPFTCSDIVMYECPQDALAGPAEKPFYFSTAEFDDAGRPKDRPGSKVAGYMQELDELVGLASVKAGMHSLRDTVEFDMWRRKFLGEKFSLLGQSFHMRFLGNPGTGKTVVARLGGKILVELGVVKSETAEDDSAEELVFKEVSRGDLVKSNLGQTAVSVRAAVQSAFGGVLFIDEAYSLVRGRKDMLGQEAVDTLIKEMEDHRDKVIVILAGYQEEMETFFESNPGFKSRVPFAFEFSDYSCEELAEIGRYSLSKQTIFPTEEADAWMSKVVARQTGCCTQAQVAAGSCRGAARDNGNGRSVRNVVEGALRAMAVRVAVAGATTKENVTQLNAVDVAAVGGEIIQSALHGTCKKQQKAIPEAQLTAGPRVLGLSNFAAAARLAGEDCEKGKAALLAAEPASDAVVDAGQIVIKEQSLSNIFKRLDQMIGLASVKLAMREFYATVEFAKLREHFDLAPVKSQSYHMRFLGNPGTGKTVIARLVGRLLLAMGAVTAPPTRESRPRRKTFNEFSRVDLVGEYMGATAPKVKKAVAKSLGGVFFLDEAYALVQDAQDEFGIEAVDTLIKEMEDKRENFVVICAGYEEEMERFFDSNPGFKSRVPFTFHFEDYNCSELSQIGRLSVQKHGLVLPEEAQQGFQEAIRLGSACCETLEDCVPDRTRGNGRAVRNVVEASVRAMARRLQGKSSMTVDDYPEERDVFSTFSAADFSAVVSESIDSRLSMPCSNRGELSKIINALDSRPSGVYVDLPANLEVFYSQLKQLSLETQKAGQLRNLDSSSANLLKQCLGKIEDVVSLVVERMQSYCSESGFLDKFAKQIKSGADRSAVDRASAVLKATAKDVQIFQEMLVSLEGDNPSRSAQEASERCAAKVRDLKSRPFSGPVNPFA
ncbi:unnamed protein product [Effrenium voratum]|nr:unnamed protein product [Effrenium voratum]